MSLVAWLKIVKALWPFVHELILDGQGQPSVRRNSKLKAFIIFLILAALIDFFYSGLVFKRDKPTPEPKPPIVRYNDSQPLSELNDRLKTLERRLSEHQKTLDHLEREWQRSEDRMSQLTERHRELEGYLRLIKEEQSNHSNNGNSGQGAADESRDAFELYLKLLKLRGNQ